MLILKLTHWTRDWDEEVDPEKDDPRQDDSLYVNAERIITMDADIQWRPNAGRDREKLEPVTRLVLTEHVHEQVTETPEQILWLLHFGSSAMGTPAFMWCVEMGDDRPRLVDPPKMPAYGAPKPPVPE